MISPLLLIWGSDDQEDLSLCLVRVLHISLVASREETLHPAINNFHLSDFPHYSLFVVAPSSFCWAVHSNCTLSTITEGCFWKSDTVFASHYLHDICHGCIRSSQVHGAAIMKNRIVSQTFILLTTALSMWSRVLFGRSFTDIVDYSSSRLHLAHTLECV